eukprot:4714129-Prymnesium_polylepis.2
MRSTCILFYYILETTCTPDARAHQQTQAGTSGGPAGTPATTPPAPSSACTSSAPRSAPVGVDRPLGAAVASSERPRARAASWRSRFLSFAERFACSFPADITYMDGERVRGVRVGIRLPTETYVPMPTTRAIGTMKTPGTSNETAEKPSNIFLTVPESVSARL